MSTAEDKKLIIKYVDTYYLLILTIPVIIILLLVASYPGYHLLPQDIFSSPYRGPSLIFGFLLFIVSLLNLKNGFIIGFNKNLASNSAFWGGLNVIFNKQALIAGSVIKYRGRTAKILSCLSLIFSSALILLAFAF